jgi:KAP family P-loop domain
VRQFSPRTSGSRGRRPLSLGCSVLVRGDGEPSESGLDAASRQSPYHFLSSPAMLSFLEKSSRLPLGPSVRLICGSMPNMQTQRGNRPASSSPAVTSDMFDADTVKAELQKIKDRLLKSDWKDLEKREGVVFEHVNNNAVNHIQELTEQDNTYSLGLGYCVAQRKKEKSRIWASPPPVLLALTVPVIVVAVAVLLAVEVSALYLFLLYLEFIVVWVPVVAINRWWKRTELQGSAVSAEVKKATTDVEKGVRSVIERSVREAVRPNFNQPFEDVMKIGEGAGLSSRVDYQDRIVTRYRPAVELHLLRPGGSAVGVTGERGIGKSELLRSFCDNSTDQANKSGGTVQVFVAVPSAFRGIEFLALIAQELARAVPGYRTQETVKTRKRMWTAILVGSVSAIVLDFGITSLLLQINYLPLRITFTWIMSLVVVASAILTTIFFGDLLMSLRVLNGSRSLIRRDAERLALRLTYAETISSQTEGSVSWGKVGLKRSGQRSLSSLPLTEAALIFEIRTLADKLAHAGYRIVIGIDEMDKLESGQATDEFLNSVKQLFAIKSCSFIVSVSTSAWAKFVRRGINLRDALDSSLDAIESVGALDFVEVRSLIRHRSVEMSDSQTLFCYILSGGLPREAMRFARGLATRNRDGEVRTHTLAEVAGLVLDDEARRLIDASKAEASTWPDVDRSIMYRKCDYLRQWWLSKSYAEPSAVEEFTWLDNDPSFLWTGGHSRAGKNPRGDGQENFTRLVLMLKFLMITRALFCQPDGQNIGNFSADDVIKHGNRLAVIRRSIEIDVPGADRALSDISRELYKQPSRTFNGETHEVLAPELARSVGVAVTAQAAAAVGAVDRESDAPQAPYGADRSR